jgi:hypothetical protein
MPLHTPKHVTHFAADVNVNWNLQSANLIATHWMLDSTFKYTMLAKLSKKLYTMIWNAQLYVHGFAG